VIFKKYQKTLHLFLLNFKGLWRNGWRQNLSRVFEIDMSTLISISSVLLRADSREAVIRIQFLNSGILINAVDIRKLKFEIHLGRSSCTYHVEGGKL
jgi:hypothetical protein